MSLDRNFEAAAATSRVPFLMKTLISFLLPFVCQVWLQPLTLSIFFRLFQPFIKCAGFHISSITSDRDHMPECFPVWGHNPIQHVTTVCVAWSLFWHANLICYQAASETFASFNCCLALISVCWWKASGRLKVWCRRFKPGARWNVFFMDCSSSAEHESTHMSSGCIFELQHRRTQW